MGTLLIASLMVWGAWKLWRSGRRVLGVLLGLWALATMAGATIRPSRAAAVEHLKDGFIQGCSKRCAEKGAGNEASCWSFCRCMTDDLRGSRSPEAFVSWMSEHAPGGVPDGVLTEATKSSALRCGDKL